MSCIILLEKRAFTYERLREDNRGIIYIPYVVRGKDNSKVNAQSCKWFRHNNGGSAVRTVVET